MSAVYDYHRVISLRELRRDFPKSILDGLLNKPKSPGIYSCRYECCMCLGHGKLEVVKQAIRNTAKVNRKKYMVTPCNHLFHPKCLRLWMMRKLKCPICEKKLPEFVATDAIGSMGNPIDVLQSLDSSE